MTASAVIHKASGMPQLPALIAEAGSAVLYGEAPEDSNLFARRAYSTGNDHEP
jgi:hypothetical protein